ncbi:hypothetical protein FFWV33_05770 [Flavobacterium faecale]|uniref:Beta-lactamase-inhibitor-like PepSY-like domain-containing protein n=1 Tax=Flavobacterium faecale TaxID=1355330 RepID=A0A2S1LBI2_9FLAO|nr:hypothetical protein [Flavobacterium faecale]AWG21074.1 hypothetical protein FFWV33_05770 [Flavobacterium faecale]
MKKILLATAIVLGSLTSIQAQDKMSTTETTTVTTTAESSAAATEFDEIQLDDVPSVVSTTLATAYPDAILTKAYVNANKDYRLDVKLGDKEGSLFLDEKGKWIRS